MIHQHQVISKPPDCQPKNAPGRLLPKSTVFGFTKALLQAGHRISLDSWSSQEFTLQLGNGISPFLGVLYKYEGQPSISFMMFWEKSIELVPFFSWCPKFVCFKYGVYSSSPGFNPNVPSFLHWNISILWCIDPKKKSPYWLEPIPQSWTKLCFSMSAACVLQLRQTTEITKSKQMLT